MASKKEPEMTQKSSQKQPEMIEKSSKKKPEMIEKSSKKQPEMIEKSSKKEPEMAQKSRPTTARKTTESVKAKEDNGINVGNKGRITRQKAVLQNKEANNLTVSRRES